MQAPKHTLAAAAALSLGLALSGCGGGGGGGGGSSAGPQAATGDFTPNSFKTDTDNALAPLLVSFDFDTTLGTAIQLDAGRTAHAAAAGGSSSGLSGGSLERQLLATLLLHGSRVRALATDTSSIACDTGNLSVTVTYVSADAPTPGDRIDITSAGCVLDGQALAGSLGIVIATFSDTSSGYKLSGRLTADGFGTAALNIDGDGSIAAEESSTQSIATVTYTGMTAVAGANTYLWDHSYTYTGDASGQTLKLSGYVHVGSASYRLRQDQEFVFIGASSAPSSGTVSLIDKDGERVGVAANSDGTSSYTLYNAGNAVLAGPVAGVSLGN